MARAEPRRLADAAARWRVLASLALPILLLQLAGQPARMALRFDRDAILAGQVWRLVTGHLLHLGWAHCALNLAGLVLCRLLAPELFRSVRGLWGRFLVLALGIGLAMLATAPSVSDYVGLSGVLYGFFVLGLLPAARHDWAAAACLVFIVGRMGWQLLVGASAEEERLIGGSVVGIAHAYGAGMAVLMLGWTAWRDYRSYS